MVQQRQMATPAYLVGAALFLIPPIDTLVGVLPIRISDARWRFGFFGLISNSMMLALAGFLIVMMTAAIFEHRRTQRTLGIVAIVLAVVLILGFGLFTLDVLQVRQQVAPNMQTGYRVASLQALCKSVLGIVTLIMFGLAALRAPKPARAEPTKGNAGRATGGLVMGGANRAVAAPRPSVTPATAPVAAPIADGDPAEAAE
ncbi:MAG: hypothetical protein ABI442_05170 [Gemmatimonadaceae bacterium]